MSGLFTSIRFVIALLTVLAIVGKPFIPPKTLVIHPAEGVYTSIYGYTSPNGTPTMSWLDRSRHAWRCDFPERVTEVHCGMAFDWTALPADCGDTTLTEETAEITEARATETPEEAKDLDYPLCSHADSDPDGDGWGWENNQSCHTSASPPISSTDETIVYPACVSPESDPDGDGWGWEKGRTCRISVLDAAPCVTETMAFPTGVDGSLDFSEYDGLSLRVHYEGRGQYLRVYVRDRNPLNQQIKPGITDKQIATLVRTEDLKTGPVLVRWDEFSVEQWWTMEQNPPSIIAGPEFRHVVLVGVDNVEPGVHRMRIDEIKLVGERISDKTYLLAILIFWIVFLLLEGVIRYYRLRVSLAFQRQELQGLAGGARLLEEEKAQLQTRALTDVLTGVLNRAGLAQHLNHRFGGNFLPMGTGLIVMDIDHFKTINDTYGHDAGDVVLQEFAKLIRSEIRENDVFARWGGEEFILLTEEATKEKLTSLAEKLRQKTAAHSFPAVQGHVVTVSLGVVKSLSNESFDDLFKRGDKALYKAKLYRNTAAYEWLE